jgi:glycosyltransferase involved in cell wall biosynthesis
MRIAVHDFAGHPFQVDLSRELARRGHEVHHLFARDLPGPKGALQRALDDPPTLSFDPVGLDRGFEKYSLVGRLRYHRGYAREVCRIVEKAACEVILSGNTPIDAQKMMLDFALPRRLGFVHWIQDLYVLGIRKALKSKMGPLATILADPFFAQERFVCEKSQSVVSITSDFATYLEDRAVHPRRHYVVENWAPLKNLPNQPRANAWSSEMGLDGKLVFLYSGTMGLKHNPTLLYSLAAASDSGIVVAVVSQGIGRDYLELRQREKHVDALRMFDFQPFERLPEVMAAADVLVATIEPDGAAFAVPSKVMSYLCAGRPILISSPADNLAARTVEQARAGFVIAPGDEKGFLAAARRLASDAELRAELGRNGRAYAERTFDIGHIGDRFEGILTEARETADALVPGAPGDFSLRAPSLSPRGRNA